jgi:cell division protein FtsW (lipid II flippase)
VTAIPTPPFGNAGVGVSSSASSARSHSSRNIELGLLALAMAIVATYSAAMEAGAIHTIKGSFWVPAAILGAFFLVLHVAVRYLAPFADPVLLPTVALLNGIGVVFLRRYDITFDEIPDRPNHPLLTGLELRQIIWTAISIGFAVAILAVVRDHKSISRYAYTLGLAGIVLVLIPAVLPRTLSEVNGAKLWIRFGTFSIQPGEFAKILLLAFFAYYLVKKREVLSLASKRFLGLEFPRGRDLGPVIMVWAVSLLVLVFEKDLGTSLMYFGMFVVTLYVATERASWLVIGLLLFGGGVGTASGLGGPFGGPFANFRLRADIWLDPFSDPLDKGYQPVQALLALGTGGLFGTGPGAGRPRLVEEVQTDFIFAGLGEEIGLFGLTALLVLYLVIVSRGLRAALGVRDLFGKLFAGGLAFTLCLQVFVIIGGVSKLIPLTGQTTPFLSAGGSSLMANWILIALLTRISDAARRPADGEGASRPSGTGSPQPPHQLREMPTEVIR